MTDTVKLRQRIRDSGYRMSFISSAIGISRYSLQRKIDNDSEFKISELYSLSRLLGLTLEEIDILFLHMK